MLISCVLILAGGCQSGPFGPYVSPRVSGQVVAAHTGLPLAGVKITRGKTPSQDVTTSPEKGAELLTSKVPAETGRDGRFVLPGERVLSIIRSPGWRTVSLSFNRAGYVRFRTNCPTAMATNSLAGEPVLDIGRVSLQPSPN